MDFSQLMQMMALSQGQPGEGGLAGALDPTVASGGMIPPSMSPQMSMAPPGPMGALPGYDPNATIHGGMSIPQGGPVLATDANINKLAMAPLDPAKLAALLGLGQGQNQQRGPMVNPGSPASGHGVQAVRGPEMAVVKRPGALGGRG